MKLLAAALLLAHLSYPPDCCGGDDKHGDCRPVPCAEISALNDGLVWHRLYFDAERRRVSPDTQCHVCARNDAYPFCIFTPEATSLDGTVGYLQPLADLKPAMRALAKRMVAKGLLSKRGFRKGKVYVTQRGNRAWEARTICERGGDPRDD